MKKKLGLVIILLIFLCILGTIMIVQSHMVWFILEEEGAGENFYISLTLDNMTEEKILPWYDEMEDIFYFFLPSCVTKNELYFSNLDEHEVSVDGSVILQKTRLCWKQDQIYLVQIDGISYSVVFMKSANLPAFFIETESGNMESVNADKNYEEKGNLTVVNKDGTVQYNERIEGISGRGNATWEPTKKPYTIKLGRKYPLCELEKCKKWNLLALYYEQDKIHSKIIYDMGREMGLESTPECTWVDLYCAGEYQGLYLLTEDRKNDYKDKDGYLLEKTTADVDKQYFCLEEKKWVFEIDEPDYLSDEQMKEISNFMYGMENMISNNNMSYLEYLDVDSIAKQFLIDKISLNVDGMTRSSFFYLDKEENKLYAGPLWDYDLSMGQQVTDYETPIEGKPNGMFDWYMTFYETSAIYDTMVSVYIDSIPYFQDILQEGIDEYAAWVEASVVMDSVRNPYRLPDATKSYREWESYVKYLKYFLVNRLNYLNSLWGLEDIRFDVPESSGEYHNIRYMTVDGIFVEEQTIMDGECIGWLPTAPDGYRGWFFLNSYKPYDNKVPIYEDIILIAGYDSG